MTDNLIPVEGENYLFRDTQSNAIINTNSGQLSISTGIMEIA